MAVIADIANIDLVVEPHLHTDEDRLAFRRAVEQHRKTTDASAEIEDAIRSLMDRMAAHPRYAESRD